MIPAGLLPADAQWCIAGGYAACPALAGDIDVWVYNVKAEDVDLRRMELLDHLAAFCAANNLNRPIWPEKRYQLKPQGASSEFIAYYEHTTCRIEKVGVVTCPESLRLKPIHIMVTDAYSPGEILQGFDVSTHAVAIESTGRIWRHVNWTPPHEAPAALLANEHTLERMMRIAERFGHPPVTQVVPIPFNEECPF